MQKHGRQFFEGPEEILVCIIDETYGGEDELDEELSFDRTRRQLETEFSQEFVEVDIAPGAELPAFAVVVQFLSDHWGHLIAAFFLAKPVSDNLEVYLKAAKSIKKYFSNHSVVLGRNAAAALAVEAVFDDMGGVPKNLECLQYYWRDSRFSEEFSADQKSLQNAPETEYLSVAVHVFKIRADGVDYRVEVDGKTVHATRV